MLDRQQLTSHIPTAALRIGLAIVLFASAFGILQKAGANYGLGVVIGVPIALGIVSFLIYRAVNRNPEPQTNPS